MKKHHICILVALVFVATPSYGNIHAQTLIETEVTTGIGASIDASARPAQSDIQATVREKLRLAEEIRLKNLRENDAYRNTASEARKIMASTTGAERRDVRDDRREENASIRTDARMAAKNASSTAERWGIRRDARFDMFRARQTAFVRQLELSIRNLEHIGKRIAERIIKAEQSGRDMTEAKSLLETAETKIEAAKQAIATVISYVPPTGTSTASTTVDLMKPRAIGNTAIKAVKDARDALQKVVVTIAHAMGLKLGQNATTTSPVFCTMDAKICPDGSAVGRVGPRCEFAPCPTATTTSSTTTSP